MLSEGEGYMNNRYKTAVMVAIELAKTSFLRATAMTAIGTNLPFKISLASAKNVQRLHAQSRLNNLTDRTLKMSVNLQLKVVHLH